jgi:hypothetical protein
MFFISLGATMVASTAMMVTTTMISSRVKPWRRVRVRA